MRVRRVALLLVAPWLLVPASCSRDTRPPRYPVRGTVTFQKRPATGAVVVLRPVSPAPLKEPLPHGEVGPDGTFRLSTFDVGDGAPAGEYVVTISWPEVKAEPGGGEVFGRDRLSGRYNDPAKSKWRVQIRERDNEIQPLEIK